MATAQNFRTAFNGFNRDDVVNYISYMTTKHENQMNQVQIELENLRQELAERSAAPAVEPEELENLRRQVAQLQEQLRDREEQIAQLQGKTADKSVPAEAEIPSVAEAELSAYRRAESAERRAMERVDQMYAKANGVIADAALRLDESTELVGKMVERVRVSLEALEGAVAQSKVVLADSAALMAAIHPEEQ